MTDNYSTGGYIDAWCTKCKMELGHTIIAMVDNVPKRVQCNTCQGKHNFRTGPAERKRTKPKNTSRRVGSKEATYEEYLKRLSGDNLSSARKYHTGENFQKDEIINHAKFGIGVVLSVPQINKMEILFKDGPKLLIQNQGKGDSDR